MIATGTTCSFCGHVYIFPCMGERYDCANAVFVRQYGRVDSKNPIEGKAVATPAMRESVKPRKQRNRIEESKSKAKRKRVRL